MAAATRKESEVIRLRITKKFRQVAAKKWRQLYWWARRRGYITFRELARLFVGQHGYYPPSGLPLTPTLDFDWFKWVQNVPEDRLYQG